MPEKGGRGTLYGGIKDGKEARNVVDSDRGEGTRYGICMCCPLIRWEFPVGILMGKKRKCGLLQKTNSFHIVMLDLWIIYVMAEFITNL